MEELKENNSKQSDLQVYEPEEDDHGENKQHEEIIESMSEIMSHFYVRIPDKIMPDLPKLLSFVCQKLLPKLCQT